MREEKFEKKKNEISYRYEYLIKIKMKLKNLIRIFTAHCRPSINIYIELSIYKILTVKKNYFHLHYGTITDAYHKFVISITDGNKNNIVYYTNNKLRSISKT